MPSLIQIAALIGIAFACFAIWFFVDKRAAVAFIEHRIAYAQRLWIFWGPRLSDRNLIQALLGNAAMLGIVSASPDVLNTWSLLLWIGANLINPTWDNHAAGETLAGRPGETELKSAGGH